MTLRTRKFIGILLTLSWILAYSLIVMAFGGVFILGKGTAVEVAFYVLGGVAWLPVEMSIIRWMSKP